MLIDWLAFPLVLALLICGCGLLVWECTARQLPAALIPGLGLALVVVAGQFTAWASVTAVLTTPIAVALALAGYGLSFRRGIHRPSGWALAAAAGVGAIYAAPIVLSGQATFAGFIKLDDTATWMALTDRIMGHGRSLAGLDPSTYEATLAFNLGKGYPIGAFLPLGIGRALVGQDVAWVIQPYMASLAAVLALVLWELPRALVPSSRLRAAVAFAAAQPALLYGYYLWGGIKELTAAVLVALTAALAGEAIRSPRRAAPVAAIGLSSGATVGVLSGGGAVWLLPALGGALVATVLALGGELALRRTAGFAVGVAILSLPVVVPGGILPPTSSPLDSATALGNLFHPLSLAQIAGVWPTGDFRLGATVPALTDVMIALLVAAAAMTVALMWKRRAWGALVFSAGTLAAGVAIFIFGSPWVGGKALATASVAIPFAAAVGAALLWATRWRPAGVALAAVIGGGVLWSNALAYRDVNLAPRSQLDDLQAIGEQIRGEGPTLMTEYEPYGVRHFLRDADPEGASELRRHLVPLLSGNGLPKGQSADTDRFQLGALLAYRTLVLRRSPAQSRPPSPYTLVYRGSSYEAWQRPVTGTTVLGHLGLGGPVDPASVPHCRDVQALASQAGRNGQLAAVSRAPQVSVGLRSSTHPAAWDDPSLATALLPRTPGTVTARVDVPVSGRYEVWLGGSVRPEVDLAIDDKPDGSVRQTLNNEGEYVDFGEVQLSPGRHTVALTFRGADLRPGSGGRPAPIGPLVLSADDPADTRLRLFPPAEADRLCGRPWDWIEALGPSE